MDPEQCCTPAAPGLIALKSWWLDCRSPYSSGKLRRSDVSMMSCAYLILVHHSAAVQVALSLQWCCTGAEDEKAARRGQPATMDACQ